jgi:hypothetical protein
MTPAWEEKATQTCGSGTLAEIFKAKNQLSLAGQEDSAPFRQLDAQASCLFAVRSAESVALR